MKNLNERQEIDNLGVENGAEGQQAMNTQNEQTQAQNSDQKVEACGEGCGGK